MNEVTAQVGTPSPVPKRLTLYAVAHFDNGKWESHDHPQASEEDETVDGVCGRRH